ncbi:APC family permease [Pelagibius marinus]|uniref:APC family permease n=1 Tax=Pelagibius marinus TaxID=2762760 RepID=UPI001D0388D5|nr:APC family permease [Pelagibius marinus]
MGGEPSLKPGPSLKRGLNLPLLVLYGLGTTIGAGIYALVGKVVGNAGLHAPFAFLLSAALVAFSAFSFAELSSRLPRSAGEAVYVHESFGLRWLALAVGLLVILAGIVSCATLARGFVGYFQELAALPAWLGILLIVAALAAVAAWGITESALLAAAVTLLEAGGLIFVVWSGHDALATLPQRWTEIVPSLEGGVWLGLLSAGVVAFYAFIGFEDMVNVAEEVKDAERSMPAAILLTLALTSVLYFLVGLVAVLAVPVDDLAVSDAPLALFIQRTTGGSGAWISLIAIVAVLNGALIQIIMAARVLYGLSAQGWLPPFFAQVHARRRTPVKATLAVAAAVAGFALLLPLETLARGTSLVTLVIFATVNLALWRLKARAPAPAGAVTFPRWISLCGCLVCAAVFALEVARLIAGL